MKLHRHPDGYVHIRDADENTMYSGTFAEFEADHGSKLPALPEGMVSFAYDSESQVMTYYDRKSNAFPVEGKFECPFSESVLTTVGTLLQKKLSRSVSEAVTATAEALGHKMPVGGV